MLGGNSKVFERRGYNQLRTTKTLYLTVWGYANINTVIWKRFGICHMVNTQLSPEATGKNGRLIVDENEYDPPVKMCGPRLAEKVKERCGKRGIYAPNESYRRFNNVHTVYQVLLRSVRRQTGSLCDYYKMYEPENVVTQCCCLGCTRWYLEQLCNPA
ncbi:hypothetical protein P879_00150 [Paragonimus westermani]|uniref:Insulin-like domain-containing protein n=1 Tax=Paragonimus westermani TaxID=34504 RepID=A0A8T0DTH0_9TREM|nr:hypothetical protein P879_00150 [Paragonimus westermani]